MTKRRLLLLFMIPLILFSSCQKAGSGGFDSFSGAFVCEYSYTEGEKLYRVRLWAADIQEDGTRNATLQFLEPATLCGIECKLTAGEYTVVCGDVSITGVSARALAATAEPLLCAAEAKFSGVSEIGGVSAERFVISTDNGEISVYVDGKSELPISLVGSFNAREIKLNIISFERKEK